MIKACRIVSGSVLFWLSAASAVAQPVEPRAADAFTIFDTYCVQTRGARDLALGRLGAGNSGVRRLPDDAVQRLQKGVPGGVAWAIRTPHNAEVMLEYTPRGICMARVLEADTSSMRTLMHVLADWLGKKLGAPVETGQPRVTAQGDTKLTYVSYMVPIGGRKAHVALTSADRRVEPQQHLMTFAYVE
jgi:hypothetical protein